MKTYRLFLTIALLLAFNMGIGLQASIKEYDNHIYYVCDVVIDGKAYELYDDYAIMMPFSYHVENVGSEMDEWWEVRFNYGSYKYSGDVVVPEQVKHKGRIYKVKSVHTHAFDNCDDITDVIIPKTVFYDFSYWNKNTNSFYPYENNQVMISAYGLGTSINAFPWLVRQPAGKVIYQDDLVAMICAYPIVEREFTPYSQWKAPVVDEIVIKDGTTKILDYASYELNVKNLVLPETLTELGANSFVNASIDSINLDNVKTIGDSAFIFAQLEDISLPNVEHIGKSAFRSSKLSHISLNPSLKAIGDYAFCDCKQLADVQLPDSLTSLDIAAFSGCTNLTDAVLPNSLTSISASAFYGCTSLANVTFTNSLTAIGSGAFYECRSLTDIVIPYSVSRIGYMAFYRCTGLKNVTIPSTIKQIGSQIFSGAGACEHLTLVGNDSMSDENQMYYYPPGTYLSQIYDLKPKEISIGSGITAIGKFYASAEVVNCYAETPPECDAYTFRDYNAELHVPAGTMAAYFMAPIWQNFSNLNADLTDKVTLEQTEAQMLKGDELQLSGATVPVGAGLVWGTTDPAVATVDASGKVTATGVGECDIYASLADNLAAYDACHIDVHNRAVISLPADKLTARLNTIVTLTPMFDPEPTEIVAVSSDPAVALVRIVDAPNNGAAHAPVAGTKIFQVLGLKEGVASITVASADGISVPATLEVTVIDHFPEGDVNCDRTVNGADVTALYNALLGENPGPAGMPAIYTTHLDGTPVLDGDVNGDGVISGADITALYNLLLN